MIEISAIVCTHNRPADLRRVLESLSHQSLDKALYEVVVVDNASDDRTRQVCSEMNLLLPNLRCVREETLGLSVARNRGIDECGGRIGAFIDDDAIASPDWLNWVRKSFSNDAHVIGMAGKTVLSWTNARPSWLPPSLDGYYGATALGEELRVLTSSEYPFGMNMAFLTSSLRSSRGFNANLGRVGKGLASFEELDLVDRLRPNGTLVYEPRALVFHCIAPDRARLSYLVRKAFWDGSSLVTYRRLNDPDRRPPPGALLAARRVAINILRTIVGRGIYGNASGNRVHHLVDVAFWSGVLFRHLRGDGNRRSLSAKERLDR